MKTSVIIPVYNRSRIICDALLSVIEQSVPAHEIVVIDDGSTDETFTVVNDFIENQSPGTPPIRYIYQKNAGPSAARNTGMRAATGDWIAFLDSDDLWCASHIARATDLLAAHPHLDVIFGLEAKFGPLNTDRDVVPSGAPGMEHGIVSDPLAKLSAGLNIPTSTAFVRRAHALAVGGMDESLWICQDLDFWMRLADNGAQFGFIDMIMCYRRMHEGNLVNQSMRTKEEAVMVLERHGSGEESRRRVACLHYDLGSAYLKRGEFGRAKAHLTKVAYAHCKNPVALAVKRGLVAFARGGVKREVYHHELTGKACEAGGERA